MAEQLQIRQVKLADGSQFSFDGNELIVTVHDEVVSATVVREDVDALVWLIKGRTARRASTKPRATKPQAVKEPDTASV